MALRQSFALEKIISVSVSYFNNLKGNKKSQKEEDIEERALGHHFIISDTKGRSTSNTSTSKPNHVLQSKPQSVQ